MSGRTVMILAGGTGGHVFPALAVAELLRAHEAAVVWVGTRTGLEARLVPQAGFPIEWLQLRALRRRSWLGLLGAAPGVLRAMARSLQLLRRHRPSVVLGMGGYASSAMAMAAWLRRIRNLTGQSPDGVAPSTTSPGGGDGRQREGTTAKRVRPSR